jgi:hypothetical protein
MARKLSSICHVPDQRIGYAQHTWWGLKQMTDTLFSGLDVDTSQLIERGKILPKLPTWFDKPEPRSYQPKLKFRTVWISDVHLGTAGCQAGLLSDFLHSIECETLYLVGDIVDGWRLRKGWYWPDQHNEVIRRLLALAASKCS